LINRHFLPNTLKDIELNCPVLDVNYDNDKVEIKVEDGRIFTCDQVIVTVPIS